MYPNYKKTVFPYSNKNGSVSWVVEFPDLVGCTAVGESEEAALQESRTACELWLDEYYEEHQSYPTPKEVSNSYSGRLVLRLPKTLHKEIAIQAEEEGVSLNTLIITLISQNYGKLVSQQNENVLTNQLTFANKKKNVM